MTPRLRFDKVVLRLMADVRTALSGHVPAGTTVLVTCTAPIRVPARTAAAIVAAALPLLTRASIRRPRPRRLAIHGNDVCLRVVSHPLAGAPPVLGFVHNPTPHAEHLLDAAARWLDLLGRACHLRSTASPARRARGQVLRVPAEQGSGTDAVDAYLLEQLRPATPFRSIVLVDNDGRETPCPSTSTRRSSNPGR